MVIHGAPKFAKTPLAKSVAVNLAMMHQAGCDHEPMALIASTIEALPRGGDRRIKSGVPVVMDDLRPGEQRLSRPPRSVEDVKVLGDPEIGGDMAGRYEDVHFEPGMPRLFTSNAANPHAFFPAFPENLEFMSAAAVMALDFDRFALVKRYAFCKITRASRNEALEVVAARLFSGANAIP